VVLVTSVVLYLATSLVNAAAIWAFGWANFVDAMFAEVSAEPTPFGGHVFTLVRWSEDDRASSWLNMNHSQFCPERSNRPGRRRLEVSGTAGILTVPDRRASLGKLNAIVAAHRAAHGSGFRKFADLLKQAGLRPADIRSLPPTALTGLASHAYTMTIAQAAAARAKKPAARHERG
jgi:hypothetical protein